MTTTSVIATLYKYPMPNPLPPGAKAIFSNRLFTIHEWPQTLYDGSVVPFESCTRPDRVTLFAFLDAETVLLTKQEQPTHHEPYFDFAGGRVEVDETPEAAARREFREETGYNIGRLEPWFVDSQNGIIRFDDHFFVARDLTPAREGAHLDPGEKISLAPTPRADIRRYVLNDALRNRPAGLVWLRLCEDPIQRARLDDFLR
jgi:ADP-ribose pyrophosphatase